MGFLKSALATSMLLSSHVMADLPPITQKGTKFFYENGTQFYMMGIAYQQEAAAAAGQVGSGSSSTATYKDPLADAASCRLDVPLLKRLRTNTIRTYAIDPTANHDACMQLLDDAGIYVIADLSEPSLSINREEPQWNVDLFDRYKEVVDSLSQYSNVIGFFAGNEVSNSANNTEASAFVKAAVRDTKRYIAENMENGGRWMGVGYAANDDADIRVAIAHYFNCGDEDVAIDYWGYNIYSWCGTSNFDRSGYDDQVDFFSNYSVPVFFAEYGCNEPDGPDGRLWDDTVALYSSQMTDVFSGGIVYMYHEEDNHFGLVQYNTSRPSPMPNFLALESQIADVSPSSTAMSAYEPTNTPQACPPVTDDWQVSGNALPPTPDRDLCSCMFNSLSCQPRRNLPTRMYGDIFNFICDTDPAACAGIRADTALGVYGPYLMCNSTHQLAHVMDAYYRNLDSAETACDFEGNATVNANPQVAGTCEEQLASASSAVSNAATNTAPASEADATESSLAIGTMRMEPMLSVGNFAVGLYLLVAMGVGAAMVVL